MTARRTRLSHIAEQRYQCDVHEALWEYNEVVGLLGTGALNVKRARESDTRMHSAQWGKRRPQKRGKLPGSFCNENIVNCSSPCRRYPPRGKGMFYRSGPGPRKEVHKYGLTVPNQSPHPKSPSTKPSTLASGKPKSGMLQIEWKSSQYHSDGRPRSRPKPSTVHGWLVKWRATFSGNERLRKQGIREMREAKAMRERKEQRRAARQAKAGVSKLFFRLWPISLGKKEQRPQAPKGLPCGTKHSATKRPSRGSSRRLTSPTQSPKSTPTNSRRSSHNRRGTGDRNPRSSQRSRKASHNNRGDIVRAAGKKR